MCVKRYEIVTYLFLFHPLRKKIYWLNEIQSIYDRVYYKSITHILYACYKFSLSWKYLTLFTCYFLALNNRMIKNVLSICISCADQIFFLLKNGKGARGYLSLPGRGGTRHSYGIWNFNLFKWGGGVQTRYPTPSSSRSWHVFVKKIIYM